MHELLLRSACRPGTNDGKDAKDAKDAKNTEDTKDTKEVVSHESQHWDERDPVP
jgi:hypothetical protein